MQDLELICFEIISNAGEARSESMEAVNCAKTNDFESAQTHLENAKQKLKIAHDVHSNLIALDSENQLNEIKLILVHSEDIMMNAEITLTMANELFDAR